MLYPTANPNILRIKNPVALAWLEYYPALGDEGQHLETLPDWRLWVKRSPQKPASLSKSPTRLLVESQLRAWVLRQSKRCLATLSFDELSRLAHDLSAPAQTTVMRRRNSAEPAVWESSFGPVRRRV